MAGLYWQLRSASDVPALPLLLPCSSDDTTSATSEASCTFVELLDGAQPSDLTLDTCALRALVLSAPTAAAALSNLRLGPTRFMQRRAVTGASGEEVVLTFDMQLQVGRAGC